MSIGPKTGKEEWRQHWSVLVPGLLGIALCAVHNYSFGVMVVPLEAAFGWTRAEISTGPLLMACIAVVIAPLLGLAVDRVGPRRIALLGVPLYCLALAGLSLTSASILSWALHWALLGMATMFILPSVWTTAVNSLFDKTRGLALATVLCGTGLGAAFVPTLTNALIESYGWRGAYVGLAGIAFLLGGVDKLACPQAD